MVFDFDGICVECLVMCVYVIVCVCDDVCCWCGKL